MKFAKKISASLALLGLLIMLGVQITSAQQGYLPLPKEKMKELGIVVPEGETAETQLEWVVQKGVDYVRYIIGAVAALYIVISGIRLVLAQGQKEVYDKQILNIVYAGVGLALIVLAGEVRDIFTLEQGGFLRDPSRILQQTRIFNNATRIIITFIKYLVGSFCVLSIANIGLRMVTYSSEDEEIAIDKKNLFYSFLGLLIVGVANTVVNKVIFKISSGNYTGTGGVEVFPDVGAGLKFIAGLTNTLVTFVAPVSIMLLLAAGIVYITAGGDDTRQETAKKMITYNIIGLVIIYGAYAIVATFIGGKF